MIACLHNNGIPPTDPQSAGKRMVIGDLSVYFMPAPGRTARAG